MIEIVQQLALIIGTGAGAYTDHKTGFIYDYITLPLIAIGLITALIVQNFNAIIAAGIVFAAGYALYYAGKLGGGDVKLFTGITLLIPYQNGVPGIIPVLIYSGLTAISFLSAYYLVKYYKAGIKIEENKESIIKAGLMLLVIVGYLYMLLQTGIAGTEYIMLIGIPLLMGIIFLAFEQGIKKEFFLKKISVKEIEEDEIPAREFMGEREKELIGNKGVIGEKEKKLLEQAGVEQVSVYRNLPRFGVFIFLGVIMAIIFSGTIFMSGF